LEQGTHPDWLGDLAARIERREFDRIVLNYRLDFEDWYLELHPARAGSATIRPPTSWRGESDGYFIYTPASTDG
jgi:hypothetical protein